MKNLTEAILMFQDQSVRDRYTSIVEEAHSVPAANLITEFARRVGVTIARSMKRAGVPYDVVVDVCDDEEFGLEIGGVLLGAFKLGVAVGIEMEKPE